MNVDFFRSRKPSVRMQRWFFPILALASILFVHIPSPAQTAVPVIDRARGKEMLQNIKQALKEVYYDPAFHGMDVDAKFKEAEKQINEAKSTWKINAILGQLLSELDDSHTRFFPPDLVVGVNFGFEMQMIGDTCYVIYIKPGSNAETKGFKLGDVIYSIEGYAPTRESLWKIVYSYFQLLPPPSLRLTVQTPKGELREIVVDAAVSKKKRKKIKLIEGSRKPPAYHDLSQDVILCKLWQFDLTDKEVDEMLKRIRSRQTLILDLRANPGGAVSMEQRLLGYFFDKDIKIGDEKRRNKTLNRIAKTRGAEKIFNGKVFVLVDSESASAAEVFARIMQLEKRATVIGDRTAGAVMTSIQAMFAFKTAADWQALPSSFYGANITIADLIMTDGKSLEKIGVTPDIVLLVSGEDLAAKRDPVLAHAASLAGVQLDADKAGAIHPRDFKDDEDDDGDKPKTDKKEK